MMRPFRCLLVPGLVLLGVGAAAAGDRERSPNLSWTRTETSLALSNDGKTVWCLVFDPAQPKSYFHPLATLDGRVLTGFEPKDHPWHRGLWWSWKYINGLNYWEENPATRTSEGVTALTRAQVDPADGFGADAVLHFSYHPPGKPAVMTERRRLTITPPDAAGTYVIDWTSEFIAAGATVKLERTVPPHQGGPGYGGYAGLSLRFPPGSEDHRFLTSKGKPGVHGQPARWVDLSGPSGGIAILDHSENLRHPTPWYLSDKPGMLYCGPALLFNETLELEPRQSITLSYRIIVHSKPLAPEKLDAQWHAFTGTTGP